MAEARAAAEQGDLSVAVSILEARRVILSESLAGRSGDPLFVSLDAELKEMQERMESRQRYEESGRAYVLSGLSSHSWQRAAARGGSTDSTSLVHSYQTPSMVDMLQRSQTFSLTPRPSIRPAGLSFQYRLNPSLLVLLVASCCGGFIYKTRVEHQHGLDALPGMTILSACLDAVSGPPRGYHPGDGSDGNSVSRASWERPSTSHQGTQRASETS